MFQLGRSGRSWFSNEKSGEGGFFTSRQRDVFDSTKHRQKRRMARARSRGARVLPVGVWVARGSGSQSVLVRNAAIWEELRSGRTTLLREEGIGAEGRLAWKQMQELRHGCNKGTRTDVGLGELWPRGEEMTEWD